MHPALLLLNAVVTALMVTNALATPVERWVDERGQVHYGERAPQGIASQRLAIGSSPTPEPEPEPEAELPQRASTTPPLPVGSVVEGELPRESGELAALCAQARDNVALFKDGRRLRLRDSASGEYRFLSDSEREAELARAEQQQRRYCTP